MSKGDFKKRKAEALDHIGSHLDDIGDHLNNIDSTLIGIEKTLCDSLFQIRDCLENKRGRKEFHVVIQEVDHVEGGHRIFVDHEFQKEPLHVVLTQLRGTIVSTVFDPKEQETTWIVEK
jgi:hypothetical protein